MTDIDPNQESMKEAVQKSIKEEQYTKAKSETNDKEENEDKGVETGPEDETYINESNLHIANANNL